MLAALYARGRVLAREDRPDGIWLDVEVPQALVGAGAAVSGGVGWDWRRAGDRQSTGPSRRGTTLQEAGR